MWRALRFALLTAAVLLPAAARAQLAVGSRFFTTSDGVRLHYFEAGAPSARTIVLVPGWTMPAWIFEPQIAGFSRHYHVIAFDPRGQGESDVPDSGYEPIRRGQDIAELIAKLPDSRVVILGWSLGVLDTLAYVHTHGDARLAGLVLVDNSVGEEPAPLPPRIPPHRGHPAAPLAREEEMRRFVAGMFRKPQTAAYLDELTEATLKTPLFASRALLRYPVPRSYWREAVYATARPVLYVVRPGFAAQADNLARNHPAAESVVITDAGHALFVDDALRFNGLVEDFLARRVWR